MSATPEQLQALREAFPDLDVAMWLSEIEMWRTLDVWPANGQPLPTDPQGGLWHDCSWVERMARALDLAAELYAERERLRERVRELAILASASYSYGSLAGVRHLRAEADRLLKELADDAAAKEKNHAR